MKILLRLYSLLRISILFLYSLGWSSLNPALDSQTVVLVLIISAVSYLLSFYAKNLRIETAKKENNHAGLVVAILTILFGVNFLYSGYIPLIGIMRGSAEYTEFPGIPFVYAFIFTFSLFYSFVLSYYFFSFKKLKYLFYLCVIIFLFGLVVSRSSIIFCLGGFVLCYFLINERKIRRVNFLKKTFLFLFLCIFVIVVCYGFGCFGNIRQGYSWYDCSYIEMLGKFNYFPEFLPKQFMWVYLYVTTPLANFNINVVSSNYAISLAGLICCFIPEFVSKRFMGDLVDLSIGKTDLVATYFNAQSLFSDFYYNYGMVGAYLSAFVIFALIFLLIHLYKKNRINNPVPIISIFVALFLTIFYNIYYYMMPSFCIIYGFLYVIYLSSKKKRLKKVVRHNLTKAL